MPKTVQEFIASATQKTTEDLIAVLLTLSEDKRNWHPMDKGRSALDQAAECAVFNSFSAALIESIGAAWNGGQNRIEHTAALTSAIRAIPADMEAWDREKTKLGDSAEAVGAGLQDSAKNLLTALYSVPTDSLDAEVDMPWGKMTVSQILYYPLWNLSYHEGQINYINSLIVGAFH